MCEMKRKQFHLSSAEENVLRKIANKTGQSEAEIVREAIKEYGKSHLKPTNPLIDMAIRAQEEDGAERDLSSEHNKYLVEIMDHGK